MGLASMSLLLNMRHKASEQHKHHGDTREHVRDNATNNTELEGGDDPEL